MTADLAKRIANFWDGDHPLTEIAKAKHSELVPMSGNCQTFQGELLRCSSRIEYDWYNNGWGCNNWSGAVMFLTNKFRELPVQPNAETLK